MPEISDVYWQNLIGILVAVAILALIIERALYQIFDSKLWKKIEEVLDRQTGGDFMDLKPWIAVAVSILIAFQLQLDMIALIYKTEQPEPLTMVITGLFIAGGSTGIYKFLKRSRRLKEAINQEEIDKHSGNG